MLLFLLVLAVLIALAVFPLMFTARALGAERTSLGWVLLVLIVQAALSRAGEALVGNALLQFVLVFLAGALVIKLALVTGYPKALLISVISTVLMVVGGLLLVLLLGGSAHSHVADTAPWAAAGLGRLA